MRGSYSFLHFVLIFDFHLFFLKKVKLIGGNQKEKEDRVPDKDI